MAGDSFKTVRGFIIPERKVELIGHLLAQNWNGYHRVMMLCTLPELRQAKTREWSNRKRDWLLRKIEKRIKQLEYAEELKVIIANARTPKGKQGRLPLTIKQIEQRIEQLFQQPDTQSNRNQIYAMTKMLRKRRDEATKKAIELAAGQPSGVLLKRQQRELRRAIGDHDHAGLEVGSICPLCGEVISRGMSSLPE